MGQKVPKFRKNNLIDHLGPLESKRSFLATFSDEIGRWEVSKPSYLLFSSTQSETESENSQLFFFSIILFLGYPSVHVLYFA